MAVSALTKLVTLTKDLYRHASTIQPDMEQNEVETFERLQELIDERQQLLDELALAMAQTENVWTPAQQREIAALQETDAKLMPLLNGLHTQFAAQIKRVSQAKQTSVKYRSAYRQEAAHGSFMDIKN